MDCTVLYWNNIKIWYIPSTPDILNLLNGFREETYRQRTQAPH